MDRSYLEIFKTALSLSLELLRTAKERIKEDITMTPSQKEWATELVEIIREEKERWMHDDQIENGNNNRDKKNTC
ncbi:hypothetical protein [Faecalimonas umbilicata]|uniref:hypothetical protein n=1 Tax=Faecalimonas umbilicata TaxID=1912855 RepID=UPI0022E4A656|nr:hypothetical protein [Faecalimonas umbilicata]